LLNAELTNEYNVFKDETPIELKLFPYSVSAKSVLYVQVKNADDCSIEAHIYNSHRPGILEAILLKNCILSLNYFLENDIHEPDDSETLKIAKSWLRNCMRNHPKCAVQFDSALPTRLIELGANEDSVRLHLSEPGSRRQYVALPYCWGTAKQFITTSSTLKSLLNWFKISQLPKTIQDALRVTRELGFRYLWIDALCILQGADEAARKDWARESLVMRSIYSDAILTVVATASRSSDEGIFRKRKCRLPRTGKPHEAPGSSYLDLYSPGSTCYSDEPINQRGWTLQERLLSTRVLNYCRFKMLWECNQTREWEDKSSITPVKADRDDIAFYRLPAFPRQMDWRRIVEAYSQRKLTIATDKFPALSALANEYSYRKRDKYLAGLWESELPESLLWMADSPNKLTSSYVAPSWSWASVGGPVPTPYGDSERSQVAEVCSWSVNLATGDPYGMISDGELVIKAPVGEIETDESKGIYFDIEAIAERYERQKLVPLCVLIAKYRIAGMYRLSGLVVENSESQPDKYIRIGNLNSRSEHSSVSLLDLEPFCHFDWRSISII
jgi:Heterokaryon incompatibility protein (HET)